MQLPCVFARLLFKPPSVISLPSGKRFSSALSKYSSAVADEKGMPLRLSVVGRSSFH
jgi:hypothetical protein